MAGGSVGTVCGVDAQAQQIDGEFTMLAGSLVVASWHGVGKGEEHHEGLRLLPSPAFQWYRNLLADPQLRISAGWRRNADAVAKLLAD